MHCWRRAALHQGPIERAPLSEGQDPYEHVNLWMLDASSCFGADKAAFFALFSGQGGDVPGGTEHITDTGRQHRDQVHCINMMELWS